MLNVSSIEESLSPEKMPIAPVKGKRSRGAESPKNGQKKEKI
jgi:hypothetical protein